MKVCSLLVIITLVTSTTPFFLKNEHLGFLSHNNNDRQLRFRIPRKLTKLVTDASQEIPFLPYLMPLQTQIKEMKKTLEQVTNDNFQKEMKKYGEDKTGVKNTWLNRIS